MKQRRFDYHVITAFSRWQNFKELRDMLFLQKVSWHIIADDCDISRTEMEGKHEPWIVFSLCPPAPEKWSPAAWPIYWHQTKARFSSFDRCMILTDDDFYEPDFVDKVDAVSGDVVIVSMKRGDNFTPVPGYGTETLVAHPDNLHHGKIGGEQIVMRGDIYSQHRHGARPDSDWDLISAVTAIHPPEFAPDAFVWFNYLEPGRWNRAPLQTND